MQLDNSLFRTQDTSGATILLDLSQILYIRHRIDSEDSRFLIVKLSNDDVLYIPHDYTSALEEAWNRYKKHDF